MPLLPAIIALIPAAVKIAELIFPRAKSEPGTGDQKKSYVFSLLEMLWGQYEKTGNMPAFMTKHKEAILALVDEIIEHEVLKLNEACP